MCHNGLIARKLYCTLRIEQIFGREIMDFFSLFLVVEIPIFELHITNNHQVANIKFFK